MILSYQVLQHFVDLNGVQPNTIIQLLNQLGLESEITHDYFKTSRQLLVAQVKKKSRHPQLQKLWVCSADTGNELLTVICGADNFHVGDKVILAPVGAVLGQGLTIKKRRFGDYVSQGMFCSWPELQINKKDNGIAVLSKEAKIGESSPLKYVDYEECLFKVETPWQEKEWNSSWIIAQYLSKLLKLPKKQSDWTKYQLTSGNKTKKGITITSSIQGSSLPRTSTDIANMFEKLQIESTNNWLDDLIEYVNWEIGVHLKKTNCQMEYRILDDQTGKWEVQINLNYQQTMDTQHFSVDYEDPSVSFSTTEKEVSYLLVFYAYQRLVWWIKKLTAGVEISEKIHLNWERQNITINQQDFNAILGNPISGKEVIDLFQDTDFKVKQTPENNLIFTVPDYRLLTNANEIASEALRLLGCNWLKPKPLTNQTIQWKKNRNSLAVEKIINYLLHLGISEKKYWSFITSETEVTVSGRGTMIDVLPKNKNWHLQNSLINNLAANNNGKENSFTIDKVFFRENDNINEKLHLGIVFGNSWIENPTVKEQIQPSYSFLVQMIINICKMLNISDKHLLKEQLVHNSKKVIIQQNLDPLIPNCGYENIFYQDQWIGQIGILQKTKQKNNYFYLEIDLTTLFKFQNGSQQKTRLATTKSTEEVYIDISLQFQPIFTKKIYCLASKDKVIECNHYQHLIEYIHSLDKTITRVHLIDQYQNKSLTFRIWKKKVATTINGKKDVFASIISKINELDNVRIA